MELDERAGKPSASYMEGLSLCPGKWNAIKACGGTSSNKYAERGNRVHSAVETGDVIDLPAEEAVTAADALTIERENMKQWMLDFGLDGTFFDHRETREWIFDKNLTPIASAKMDMYSVCKMSGKRYALIQDTKSGWKKIVSPKDNLQLRTQAVAVAETWNPDVVRVCLVQPVKSKQLPPCDFTREDLKVAKEEIVEIVRKSSKHDAPRIPGITQCEYCPAMGTHACEESRREAFQIIPNGLTLEKKVSMAWDQLTPGGKLDLYRKAKLALKVHDYIDRKVKEDLTANPEAIPGLRKLNDGALRKITNMAMLYAKLEEAAREYNYDRDLFVTHFVASTGMTIESLTELYKQITKAKSKDAATWIKELPETIIKTKPIAGRVEFDTKAITQIEEGEHGQD